MPETGGKPGAEGQFAQVGPTVEALHEAPTIFFDGAQGLVATGDLFKFNLYQDRIMAASGDEPIKRVVCARLVMTNLTAVQLFDWLKPAVESVRAQLAQKNESVERSSAD